MSLVPGVNFYWIEAVVIGIAGNSWFRPLFTCCDPKEVALKMRCAMEYWGVGVEEAGTGMLHTMYFELSVTSLLRIFSCYLNFFIKFAPCRQGIFYSV